MRICIKIIFHLSKLWKAKFSLLCDVVFLVGLEGKFDIDHSQEWKGQTLHKSQKRVTLTPPFFFFLSLLAISPFPSFCLPVCLSFFLSFFLSFILTFLPSFLLSFLLSSFTHCTVSNRSANEIFDSKALTLVHQTTTPVTFKRNWRQSKWHMMSRARKHHVAARCGLAPNMHPRTQGYSSSYSTVWVRSCPQCCRYFIILSWKNTAHARQCALSTWTSAFLHLLSKRT